MSYPEKVIVSNIENNKLITVKYVFKVDSQTTKLV